MLELTALRVPNAYNLFVSRCCILTETEEVTPINNFNIIQVLYARVSCWSACAHCTSSGHATEHIIDKAFNKFLIFGHVVPS